MERYTRQRSAIERVFSESLRPMDPREILDAALLCLNKFARVAVCGWISTYNVPDAPGPKNLWQLVAESVTLQGFTVLDYRDRFPEGVGQLAQWLLAGKIKHREDIVDGLDNILPTFLRLVRGTVLAIKTEEYVEAAQALGCSRLRVALRHILPNTLPPLFVQVSITVAAAIIAEASLSFLGLGQQPPAPSWGSMLNAAQRYLSQAPWMALYPGLMIFGIVMALNVLGDGLRDVLDPRHQ